MEQSIQDVIKSLKELTPSNRKVEVESIEDILYEYLEEYDDEVDIDLIGEFLAHTLLNAYLERFDNDIIETEDLYFGFSELDDIIESLHNTIRVSDSKDAERQRVRSNLLAVDVRDISLYEYLEPGYIEEDIKLVHRLISKPEPDLNSKYNNSTDLDINRLMEQVTQDPDVQDTVDDVVTSILTVYKHVMAGAFEIEPYFGVFSLEERRSAMLIKDSSVVFARGIPINALSKILGESIGFKLSTSRQFDIDEILESKAPVYFPLKILEYLYGRVSTVNLQSNNYSRFDGGSGWDVYAEQYVRPNLTHFLNEGVLKMVLHHKMYDEDGNLEFTDYLNDISKIQTILRKLQQSMVTMVVIPECESNGGSLNKLASIKVRVVKTVQSLPTNKDVIGKLIATAMMGKGSSTGEGYTIEPETVTRLDSFDIVEYGHTFDSKMANIRPLFAYQALDALQAKGDTVNWDNIVLGKGMDGRTVTAYEGGSIDLRPQLIHNIFAGSRSGKGVMTLNTLATAISSGRPTFYQDRKPDMASLFAEYVGVDNGTPNMYLLNGGAYVGRFDPNSVLNYDQLSFKWKDKVPEWWNATSYTDIGDIVYYRGIIFTLGILLLRLWAQTSDKDLYEFVGGDGGVVIVYDEFTNWQNTFSTRRINPRGSNTLFSKSLLLGNKDMVEYQKALLKIEEIQDNPSPSAKDKGSLLTAEQTVSEIKTPKRAYVTDMLDNLDRTLLELYDKQNAGFKNGEERLSDIFIIGQDIEVGELPDSLRTFPRNQTGGLNASANFENTCALSTFFYNFSTDWFLGYNGGYPRYMKANVESSPSKHRLTAEARNFAYYKGSRDEVRGAIDMRALHKETTFFKPYLILNNAKEPKPLSKDKTERERQCQQPEYQYVGGVILNTGDQWEKIREQNIDKTTGELRKEIGFFDYLTQMSRGSGSNVDPKQVLGRSKEIADRIVKQMGYDGDYLDFLMDLRPEWNFSALDIRDAFANPESVRRGDNRIAMYRKLFLDEEGANGVDEESDDMFSGVVEDVGDFGDVSDDSLEEGYEDNSIEDEELDYEDTTESDSDDFYNDLIDPEQDEDDYVGVDDPFGPPVDKEVPQPIDPVVASPQEMTTEELLRELLNRGIKVEGLDKYENGWGSYTEQYGNTSHQTADVPKFEANTSSEEEYFKGYYEFCEYICNDIIQTYGGYEGFEHIVIRDGMLYVNKVKYSKRIPNEALKGLPLDRIHQIRNGNYGLIFNFNHLVKMPNLAYISIDNRQFLHTKLRTEMKLTRGRELYDLFMKVPNLYYLNLENKEWDREEVMGDNAKYQSFFRSAEKREKVADKTEQFGIKTMNSTWNTSKRLWGRKGFWNKTGSGIMAVTSGVTAVTTGGFKGLRLFTKEVKELFRG